MNPVLIILLTLLGIGVGGLLNMLADDLPFHRRVQFPPRYRDGTPRPPIAWLGITAFLFGKRRPPNGEPANVEYRFGETETGEAEYVVTLPNRVSLRYPLTEILTAAAMILTYSSATNNSISTSQFVFWLIYMAILVLVLVIDIEHKLILFAVMIPSFIIAIVDALFMTLGFNTEEPAIIEALLGGALGFIVFYLFYLGGFLFTGVMSKARGREIREVAFGYGDVMLITFAGLMLGWRAVIFTMFITVVLGAIGAFVYLVFAALLRNRYQAFTALPYGPYIVIATALMLLFRAEMGQFFGAYFP